MQIRLDADLKAEAERVLDQLSLSPTEFVRMALRQLVLRQGLPFEVKIPNAETVAAFNEDLTHAKRFKSVDDFMSDLHSDDD